VEDEISGKAQIVQLQIEKLQHEIKKLALETEKLGQPKPDPAAITC
jgi:hypothetical protein